MTVLPKLPDQSLVDYVSVSEGSCFQEEAMILATPALPGHMFSAKYTKLHIVTPQALGKGTAR